MSKGIEGDPLGVGSVKRTTRFALDDSHEEPDHEGVGDSHEEPDHEEADDEVDKKGATFPYHALPPVVRGVADEMQRLYGTGPLAGLGALVVLGYSCGRGLRMPTCEGRKSRANMYLIGAAGSGTGKSLTMDELLEPVRSIEKEKLEEWEGDKHTYKAKIGDLNEEQKRLRRKKGADENDSRLQDLARIEKDLEENEHLMKAPSEISQDITDEELVRVLARNDGNRLSASTECSRMIQERLGGYSKDQKPRDALWNAGWSGERYLVDRVTSGKTVIDEPFMSLFWITQPGKLRTLMGNDALAEEGALARCMIVPLDVPAHRVSTDRLGMNESVRDDYKDLANELYDSFRRAVDEGEHRVVTLPPDALQVLVDWQRVCADLIEGSMWDCAAFPARWYEMACRLTLALHAARHGGRADSVDVSVRTAKDAVELMQWVVECGISLSLTERRENMKMKRKARLEKALRVGDGGRRSLSYLENNHGLPKKDVMAIIKEFPNDFKRVEGNKGKPGRNSDLVQMVGYKPAQATPRRGMKPLF